MAKPGGVYSDPILISQYLTEDGLGTGAFNASGNYSSEAKIFSIKPGSGEVFIINELTLHLVDGGALAVGNYGSIPALENGILITVTNAGSVRRPILPRIIKTNLDLVYVGNGGFNLVHFTAGIDAISATIDFRSQSEPLILDGDEGHVIEVFLNDDFTGVDDHNVVARGTK